MSLLHGQPGTMFSACSAWCYLYLYSTDGKGWKPCVSYPEKKKLSKVVHGFLSRLADGFDDEPHLGGREAFGTFGVTDFLQGLQ